MGPDFHTLKSIHQLKNLEIEKCSFESVDNFMSAQQIVNNKVPAYP